MRIKKFPLFLVFISVFIIAQGSGLFSFLDGQRSTGGDGYEQKKSAGVVVLCESVVNNEPINLDSVFFENENIYLYLRPLKPINRITVNWYRDNVVQISNTRNATGAPVYYWRLTGAHRRPGLWSVHVLVDDSLYLGGLNFVIKPGMAGL